MNSGKKNPTIAKLTVLLILLSLVGAGAGEFDPPFPRDTEIIFWSRPDLIASDLELGSAVTHSQFVNYYLSLLKLSIGDVDFAAIFMPYDQEWLDKSSTGKATTLPPNGSLIIKGKFDPLNKYKALKAAGWDEDKYTNKKLLWWSIGENYLKSPSSAECVTQLGVDMLLISGSQRTLKGVLDVAGNKAPGIEQLPVFTDISRDFMANDLTLAGFFVKANSQIRQKIHANMGDSPSPMVKTALQYVDNVQESALSIVRAGNNYLLDGYLGMNSGNNAMVVASVLQLGGSLASLLPEDDPNRETLQNLTISRNERTIKLHSQMTKAQLRGLFNNSKH